MGLNRAYAMLSKGVMTVTPNGIILFRPDFDKEPSYIVGSHSERILIERRLNRFGTLAMMPLAASICLAMIYVHYVHSGFGSIIAIGVVVSLPFFAYLGIAVIAWKARQLVSELDLKLCADDQQSSKTEAL